jgi:hypothetical protein
LTKEGQTVWSTAVNQLSLRLDVPTEHLSPGSLPSGEGKWLRHYVEENIESPAALRTLLNEVFAN